MDEMLRKCSEGELLHMARTQGIGILKRGLDRETLIKIVSGELAPREHELAVSQSLSSTNFSRQKLQIFIEKNWGVVANQLPGCDGKCTTYPCSDTRHSSCLSQNRDLVMR